MSQGIGIPILQQATTAAVPLDVAALAGGGPPGSVRAGARSLYIHVPFCFHKCHYCDFYSFVDSGDQQRAYLDALVIELRRIAPFAGRLETVFIGGGTPTLLRTELWGKLLGVLDELFGIADRGRRGLTEFTVECNPETATPELMAILAAGGVNRLSVGAQSFVGAHLKTLERWHDPRNVERALGLAADAGIRRRSLDLIFAIPGQTPAEWESDLRLALDLKIGGERATEHISCYALTYEPNTAMTRRKERGEFAPAPEADEIEMFEATRRILAAEGFHAYEISNFASSLEARCRHNLAYWRQEEWLAAGPSGAAHLNGWRWKNLPNLGRWMEGILSPAGLPPVIELEGPDRYRALAELVMTSLRLLEGIDADMLQNRAAGLGCWGALERRLLLQQRRGLIELHQAAPDNRRRWRLTERGVLFADGIAADLMAAIAPARNSPRGDAAAPGEAPTVPAP